MANNYTLFSEALSLHTFEQRRWWDDTLKRCEEIVDSPDDEHTPSGNLSVAIVKALIDWGYLGFQHEIYHDHIVFYSEDTGGVGVVGLLVQRFLREFDPYGCWALTWAESCSKPRIGEFSGGGMFVTARNISFQYSGGWTQRMIRAHEKRMATKKRKKK